MSAPHHHAVRMALNDEALGIWTSRAPENFAQRVLGRLDGHPDAGSCWVWSGARGPHGHGRVRLPEALGGHVVFVHRAVWIALRGPIGYGLVIDHGAGCGNTSCANPDHLRVTDQGTNVKENKYAALRARLQPESVARSVEAMRAALAGGDAA